MYGDNIIEEYKLFERSDPNSYKKFEEYIRQYATAEMFQTLQGIISIYNSPILKWERFKAQISRRKAVIQAVIDNAENSIYTALESGEKVNILSELEKALEDYRGRIIRKGASKYEQI